MDSEVKRWLSQVDRVKKGDLDLSRDEDLSIALMNLISLEEHFYFTAMKTEDSKYLELLNSVRELRKNLLKEIVVDPKGEEWCISKHLLAGSMRLIEVGTKELGKNNLEKANSMFKAGFELYSLFFAINLKLLDSKGVTVKLNSEDKLVETEAVVRLASDNKSLMGKFSKLVKQAVDCCRE